MPSPPRNPANFPRSGYSDDEREFLMAMERYMREADRPFPCWHEVLRVLKSLGYRKIEENSHHRDTEAQRKTEEESNNQNEEKT